MSIDNLLSRLGRVHKARGGWVARCPAHEDRNPSLSIAVEGNRILLKCFAGCGVEAILRALGLKLADLFIDAGEPHSQRKHAHSITVDDLARDKKLPSDFLRSLGLENCSQGVRVPYKLMDGSPAPRQRIRTALVAREGSLWDYREGVILPYGLWRLFEARKTGDLILCEGESDSWTLWFHSFHALGIPGASMVGCLQGEHLAGIGRLSVIQEPDAAGAAFVSATARRLREVGWKGQALVVSLDGAKDPNELHKGSAEEFKKRFQAALDAAQSLRVEMTGGFALTCLRDLLNEPDEKTAYLVHDILPSGGLSALVSKPKVGKSTLARELALHIARGEPFLGRETAMGPVVYLALEEKRSEVRSHFRAMGATGTEEIYIHAAHAPADALRALQEMVREKKPALIIIDPLQKLMRVKDGNDYAQVTLALEPFLIIARESGAHLLVIHHLGKSERSDPTDGILGSTAIFAGVDTAIILKKTERYRTIQTVQRYGEDLPETVLQFDAETKTVSLGQGKQQAEEKRAGDSILEFLKACSEPPPEAAIMQEVEGRTRVKKAALRVLVAAGEVSRSGSGKRGDPYLYEIENAGSQHIQGTREPEPQQVGQTRANTDAILVPESLAAARPGADSAEPETEERSSAPKVIEDL